MKLNGLYYKYLILSGLVFYLFLPSYAVKIPVKLAVEGTIERILGEKSAYFTCNLINKTSEKDFFEIESVNGKIKLSGTSQPAIGYALNYYLTQYCRCQLSHVGENLSLPDPLPVIPEKIRKESPYQYRYFYNYCTYNYAKAFWNWEQWEKEIDWMVIHGINMPLAIIGTEAVWQNTLRQFNVPEDAISRFIPGPAYTAWWLMGNLEGWGGPVSQAWIDQQAGLQQKIVGRMRQLGMTPVFQGFYGMVPDTLRTLFPTSKIYYGGLWAGDEEGFRRPAFLDPSDPLFAEMAGVYYQELEKLYGKTTFYGGDPFHEGGNTENIDITKSASLIQQSMLKANPEAIWALQGWWDNPTDLLLAGVDKQHTMVLDLYAEGNPQWERRKGFGDVPWIWCSLLNFGGKIGMYSRIDQLATEPARALKSEYGKKLTGIGMMMEGDKTNPVNFELTFDAAWSAEAIEPESWIPAFAHSRYGSRNEKAEQAWQIISTTVLNCPKAQEGTSESIFCARGDSAVKSAWRWGFINIYYAPEKLQEALKLLLSAENEFRNKDTYQYDVVDLTRQVISNYAYSVYNEIMLAFNQKNKELFSEKSEEFIQLIDDQDKLLATRKEFLLGVWIESAKNNATSRQESALFEWNARTLITVWGDEGVSKVLHEYANREWSGMLKGLYRNRWLAYIEVLNRRLEGIDTALPDYYAIEEAWTRETTGYSVQPEGNPVDVANELYKKYFK
ncbi:MAG: alpha-N-acetylglucosaminidase [Bacteroidales bacterium]|nr:alpha-N-acetylglucosaminidase [Bacteroidales bacterium]